MLAQGYQFRWQSTQTYMYPCLFVTPKICIVSLPVIHVLCHMHLVGCLMKEWDVPTVPRCVDSLMHLGVFFGPWWRMCVCVCVRRSWCRHIECGTSAGRCIAQLYCGILHSGPPLRGCERVDVVTSLAAYCRPNLSWPSGTNWLDPVCARIHQGW